MFIGAEQNTWQQIIVLLNSWHCPRIIYPQATSLDSSQYNAYPLNPSDFTQKGVKPAAIYT
jgi:hypothetical protein